MYMQHLFHGRIQIVSLDIICLDSDVPCRAMDSFTSTILILQAFLVPCDRGVRVTQPVFVYPHVLGYRIGRWYLLRPPHPKTSLNPFHSNFWQAGGVQCVSQKLRHLLLSDTGPSPWTWPRTGGALLTGCAMCLQARSRCFCGEGGKREVFLFCQWVGEVLKL